MNDLRVIEIADGLCSASLCGQLLVNFGAEVIKFEHDNGDSLRHASPKAPDGNGYDFHLLNAGKSSVLVDAHSVDSCADLIEDADIVLLEGKLPAALEQLLAPATRDARFPRTVFCSVNTFGRGERRDWTGDEFIAQAFGGLMSCTGYPDLPPVQAGLPFVTHVTAFFALNGIMAALFERDQSGRGQSVDVSMVESLIALLGNFVPSYCLSGKTPNRIGNRHTLAAPWNLYPAADGFIVICTGVGGQNWWGKMASLVGRPDLTHDPRYEHEPDRVARVDEVDALVSAWTKTLPKARIAELLLERGIPASEIVAVEGALIDPHFGKDRGMIGSASLRDGGRVATAGSPLKATSWEAPSQAGPALGESRIRPRVRSSQQAGTTGFSEPTAGRPLRGLRVIEFGSRTSVPLAGRMLADLGAEILKVEPRKGDPLRQAGQIVGGASYLFHINNAGKQSVSIDPNHPEGRKLILELAATADIWIENLAPGVLEKMGFGYEDVRAVNPQIIYGSCSGFGHQSALSSRRALDTVVQAASGMMYLTGHEGHFPVKLGISAIDLATGIGIVGAVLAGLRARREGGAGKHVDVAMADVGFWMTQSFWTDVLYRKKNPTRLGNRSRFACPHNLFAAKDGDVAISVRTDTQWKEFARLIGDADLAENAKLAGVDGRLAHVEQVEAAVARWTSARTAEAIAAELQSNGIPAAPLRTIKQIVDDADVQRQRLVVDCAHPFTGNIKLLGNPIRFSRTPISVNGPSPAIGEHSRAVLGKELALSAAEISALIDQQIIFEPAPNSAAA